MITSIWNWLLGQTALVQELQARVQELEDDLAREMDDADEADYALGKLKAKFVPGWNKA